MFANFRRRTTMRPANTRLPLALRFYPLLERESRVPSDPHGRDARLARVEAALMLADEPLTSKRIADAADLKDGNEARTLIEKLRQFYDADGTAFQIEDIAGGYQLLTRAAIHPWLLRLRRTGHDVPLTSATMETLAVIAYKQPIMRAEIEKIRGVQCADLIRVLMEKGLVRIAGRHDSLGRPQLYGTTKTFLEAFGLNELSDLPVVASLKNPG